VAEKRGLSPVVESIFGRTRLQGKRAAVAAVTAG
jgi:hypothetical protein